MYFYFHSPKGKIVFLPVESEPLPRGIQALSPLACPCNRVHRLSKRPLSSIPTGKVNRFLAGFGHFPLGESVQPCPQALQAAILWYSLVFPPGK